MTGEALQVTQRRHPGSTFRQVDVSGSTFGALDASGSTIDDADLRGMTVREVALDGAVVHGAYAETLELSGEFERLVVNGVDVMPLVEAELDRRHPERPLMRPTDPEGFRTAWDTVESFWGATVRRAQDLDPDLLHESVNGEWSFVQTLRHLTFATDCWVSRAVLGDPAPWHPLGLPWSGMPPTDAVPDDREARPTLDEVLAVRRDRMGVVRRVVDGLTPEQLASETTPVEGPGWPEPRAYPVRECLLTVLNEEWWHHRFALRDLAVLTGEPRPD